MKNAETFGVSLHQAVFDSVVDHLHEMTCSRWSTMEVTILYGANFFPTRRAHNLAASRRQSLEDWIEMTDCLVRPADHHAVATLQAPHAAAGSHVNVINTLPAQGDRPARVVFEIRITAVDDDVVS